MVFQLLRFVNDEEYIHDTNCPNLYHLDREQVNVFVFRQGGQNTVLTIQVFVVWS